MTVAGAERVFGFDTEAPADPLVLGGKGAGLVRMSRLGLPVPPGFVVPTWECATALETGDLTPSLKAELLSQVARIGQQVGRRFGDPLDPLLVSVRSGAPVSMPGMMDTVLNLGLTDPGVPALARRAGEEFARETYARLLRCFGTTVRGIAAAALPEADDPSALLAAIETLSGSPFPQDPTQQLFEAVLAVFRSWNSPRAVRYRKHRGHDAGLGTAVVVQAMVFGNSGDDSGTGVAFTRDPATGAPGLYGDFLADAQGEDLVAGVVEGTSLEQYDGPARAAVAELRRIAASLELEYRDMLDIEFTVEGGRLFLLQVRPGQRSAAAAVRIALDLLEEGVLSADEALSRVTAEALLHSAAPRLVVAGGPIGVGTPASPGAAVGALALTSEAAERMAAEGLEVILVRPSTSPDDIAGILAARGILTQSGGRTSHAAVVARGLGRPAVCSVAGLVCHDAHVAFGDVMLREGDLISFDGTTGDVYAGALELATTPADPRLEKLLALSDGRRALPVLAVERTASWADGVLEDGPVWRLPEDITAVSAGQQIVVELADPEVLTVMLQAVSAAVAAGARAVLLVDRHWPASLKALPDLGWSAIAATTAGAAAARLLAGQSS